MSQQVPRSDLVDNLLADLTALEERVAELEAERDRLQELEKRVDELDERTDMLRLIEEADQLDADQRRAALWQHAYREARQSRTGKVALDREDVDQALHRPDVHRTTLYTDMSEVADGVTVNGVAEYIPRSESETDAAELRIDLGAVDDSVDASTLYNGGD